MRLNRKRQVPQPDAEPVLRLTDEETALLRKVIGEACRSRLLEDDWDGAMACKRLQIKILYPPIEVDWDATRAGRRIAARDASA